MKRSKRVLASIALLASMLLCLTVVPSCVTGEEVQAQVDKANSAEDRIADGTLRKQTLARERTLLEQRLDTAPASERAAIEEAIKAVDERVMVVELDMRRAAREFAEAEAMIDALDEKLKGTPGKVKDMINTAGSAAGNAGVPGAGLIGQTIGEFAHEAVTWLTTGGAAAAAIAAWRARRRAKDEEAGREEAEEEVQSLQTVVAVNEHLGLKEIATNPQVNAIAKLLVELLGAKDAFERAKRAGLPALPEIPIAPATPAAGAPVTT